MQSRAEQYSCPIRTFLLLDIMVGSSDSPSSDKSKSKAILENVSATFFAFFVSF